MTILSDPQSQKERCKLDLLKNKKKLLTNSHYINGLFFTVIWKTKLGDSHQMKIKKIGKEIIIF
jgi:hypothetical protein